MADVCSVSWEWKYYTAQQFDLFDLHLAIKLSLKLLLKFVKAWKSDHFCIWFVLELHSRVICSGFVSESLTEAIRQKINVT